jgi:hypothetical protein
MEQPIVSWEEFWAFVRTPAGLGIIVVAIVGLLKRLTSAKLPAWMQAVGTFVSNNAMFVSILVALPLSALVFIVGKYNLEAKVGEYFVILALAWAASQSAYALQKAGAMYFWRVKGGGTTGAVDSEKSG